MPDRNTASVTLRMDGPLAPCEAQCVRCSSWCCPGLKDAASNGELEAMPLLHQSQSLDTGVALQAPQVMGIPMHGGVQGNGQVQDTDMVISCSHSSKGRARPKPDRMLVMRHGHRADEDSDTWTQEAERPWDPPLSALGRQQAHEAGQQLAAQQADNSIEYVISSPYLRCLQTSAEVMAALQLPRGRWLVDWSMGEVGEPRLLLSGRDDVDQRVHGQPLETWMWQGDSIQQALQQFVEAESSISGISADDVPVSMRRPVPPYPETRESAEQRYMGELTSLAEGGTQGQLQGNLLVVTHGEAVRCAVNLMEPEATVYEVTHCGLVVLAQSKPPVQPGGKEGVQGILDPPGLASKGWRLACQSRETGVSWFG